MTDFAKYRDLSKDEALAVTVYDPTGRPEIGDDGEPVQLFLLPPACPKAVSRIEEIAERRRKRAEQNELTREDSRDYEREINAAFLEGWSNNWEIDGEKPEFSRKAAVDLAREIPPFNELLWRWRTDSGNCWRALLAKRSNGRDGEASSTGEKAPA